MKADSAPLARLCPLCGEDISDRHWKAKYCPACAVEANRRQAKERARAIGLVAKAR